MVETTTFWLVTLRIVWVEYIWNLLWLALNNLQISYLNRFILEEDWGRWLTNSRSLFHNFQKLIWISRFEAFFQFFCYVLLFNCIIFWNCLYLYFGNFLRFFFRRFPLWLIHLINLIVYPFNLILICLRDCWFYFSKNWVYFLVFLLWKFIN